MLQAILYTHKREQVKQLFAGWWPSKLGLFCGHRQTGAGGTGLTIRTVRCVQQLRGDRVTRKLHHTYCSSA